MAQANEKVEQRIAYICLYKVSRQYGGPEEGGWYFQSYEWLGIAIPFNATITFNLREFSEDDDAPEVHNDGSWNFPYAGFPDEKEDWWYWDPTEIIPDDSKHPWPQRETAWFEAAKDKLKEYYDTDEYVVVVEYHPGRRGLFRRPRYS